MNYLVLCETIAKPWDYGIQENVFIRVSIFFCALSADQVFYPRKVCKGWILF